jgi:gamma-glutamylaminecyclotransferase
VQTIDLFVYGTLKRGQRRHHLLADQEFRGLARTLPRYRLYDCGSYPGLVIDDEHGLAVEGEWWRIDAALLPALDQYEGAPLLFRRQAIELDGVAGPVIAYFYQGRVAAFRDRGPRWDSA